MPATGITGGVNMFKVVKVSEGIEDRIHQLGMSITGTYLSLSVYILNTPSDDSPFKNRAICEPSDCTRSTRKTQNAGFSTVFATTAGGKKRRISFIKSTCSLRIVL